MEGFILLDVIRGLDGEMHALSIMLMAVNFVLHVIFAGAVARDAGDLTKHVRGTYLVSGLTWAFATLVGGVLVVGLYWLVHHSNLTRH